MMHTGKIDENLRKIEILSQLYKDLISNDITNNEELEIIRLKAKVARAEMLNLIYHNHKLLLG